MVDNSVPCPQCRAVALSARRVDYHHGNPVTPAADVEISVHYVCGACDAGFVAPCYVSDLRDAQLLVVDPRPRIPAVSPVGSPPVRPRAGARPVSARLPAARDCALRYDGSEDCGLIGRARRALSVRLGAARSDPRLLPAAISDLDYIYAYLQQNDSFSRSLEFVVTPTTRERSFVVWLKAFRPELVTGNLSWITRGRRRHTTL